MQDGILSLHPWDHKLLDDDIPEIVQLVFHPLPKYDFFQLAPHLAYCVYSTPYSATVLSHYELQDSIFDNSGDVKKKTKF